MPDDTPDESIDESQFDDIRAVLGDLAFLDPASAPAPVPMPEAVWAHLHDALAAEAVERAGADHADVVVLTPTNHPSRTMRWAGGLVAASVAVVAVSLAVGAMRAGSDDPVTVAGGAAITTAPAATAQDRAAELAATPEAATGDTMVAQAVPAVVPAARMVMSSKTDYLPEQLPEQVVSLVKKAGFTTLEEAMAKVVPQTSMPVADGFTASWEALRACLTWLTQSPGTQALIVDRATYAGNDAGVIVAPATVPADDSQTSSPTVTVESRYGAFDVWVVDADCTEVESTLVDFSLYQWRP